MRLSRDSVGIAGVLTAFAVLWYLMLLQGGEGPQRQDPRASSYNSHPAGLRAWFLLLQSSGRPVARWAGPLERIPGDGTAVLAQTPVSTPIAEREASAVARWVERGGRLVLLTHEEGALSARLGIRPRWGRNRARLMAPEYPTALTRGMRRLFVEAGRARLGHRSLVPHFQDAAGVVVGEWRLGRGSVLLLADPDILTNAQIGRADNALLALSVVGDRPVYFDEYHQGYRQGSPLWSRLSAPARWALLQLLLALLLGLWTASRRFGTPLHPAEGGRSQGDFVLSMAALLRRAEGSGAAAELVGDAFRRDLAASLGIPPESDDAELAEAAALRTGRDTEDLSDLLKELRLMRPHAGTAARPSEARLLAAARRVHAWREELDLNAHV